MNKQNFLPVINREFDHNFNLFAVKVTYEKYPEEPEIFYNVVELEFDPLEDILIIKSKYNTDSFPIEVISNLEIILKKE